MKVTKAALLGAIDAAFVKHDQDAADYATATRLWTAIQAKNWQINKVGQWRDLRDLITKSLKSGTPITTEMVASCLHRGDGYRSSVYISDHTFNPTAPPPDVIRLEPGGVGVRRPAAIPAGQLKALKLFLESCPEEEFTMEALSRLGFKAPAFVFRAAVGAGPDVGGRR